MYAEVPKMTIDTSPDRKSTALSGWRGPLVAALLSIVFATLDWRKAPPPNWTTDLVPGKSRPVGFTRDGKLVSLDDGHITVREAATGQLLDPIERPSPFSGRWDWGELTPDGEWVILREVNSPNQLHVISRHDGQPRCPPIPVTYSNPTNTSPNGRYKHVFSGKDQQSIVDLTNGTILCDTPFYVQFSPDSQSFVSFDIHNAQYVVFHSVTDGRELGRALLRSAPVGKWHGLGQWHGDRLELEAKQPHPPAGGTPSQGYDRRTYSFRVSGLELTDMREEPALAGSMIPVKVGMALQTCWVSGDGWATRDTPHNPPSENLVGWWNWFSARIPTDPFRWVPVTGSEWQLVSRTTGQPLHRPIFGKAFGVAISPDGQWLAFGGEQLRVWHLPPRSRLPGALLLAAVPWLVLVWWRWRRARIQGGMESKSM